MPYDGVPTENAPANTNGAYDFKVDMNRATVDDLEMFDSGVKIGNRATLDFLDRIVVEVTLNGKTLLTRKTIKETYEEDGEKKERERVEERVEGVRGKNIPYPKLSQIWESVGAAMKEINDQKNSG